MTISSKLTNPTGHRPQPRVGRNTDPMTTHDMTSLVNRLHADCAPLQEYRELTENAIQAVARTGIPGKVVWDVDWVYLAEYGVQKLCCIDTGGSMTEQEQLDYLNQLASGVERRGLGDNFGIGTKIAVLPNNKYGVVYWCWPKIGIATGSTLWYDPVEKEYGRKYFEGVGYTIPLDGSFRPEQLIQSGHGTKVTLLGNSDRECTMNSPRGHKSKRWLIKYLNSRYFEFPEDVEVYAREGWHTGKPRREPHDGEEGSDGSPNQLRRLSGQKEYLDNHSVERGTIALTDSVEAFAHWWILGDAAKLQKDWENILNATGHIAALYQSELYEIDRHHQKLANFGITKGHKRVVIYIEPVGDAVKADTTRTNLVFQGSGMPWDYWAEEFCKKMPPCLRTYVDEQIMDRMDNDIRDKLRPLMELFDISRYIECLHHGEPTDGATDTFEGVIPWPRPGGGPALVLPTTLVTALAAALVLIFGDLRAILMGLRIMFSRTRWMIYQMLCGLVSLMAVATPVMIWKTELRCMPRPHTPSWPMKITQQC